MYFLTIEYCMRGKLAFFFILVPQKLHLAKAGNGKQVLKKRLHSKRTYNSQSFKLAQI